MILWINGAFGAGKTSTAYELRRRLPDAYVYDPENAGYFIRGNIPPSIRRPDFQDYPEWRRFNRDMLTLLAREYTGTIIVPMTVTRPDYYAEMTEGLMQLDSPPRHFILYASKQTLQRRLTKRLERKDAWARAQIDRCIHAFDHELDGEKLETDELNIDQVVATLASRSGLTLLPDRRSRVRRSVDRLIVTLQHIRGK